MEVQSQEIPGVFCVTSTRHADARGSFARLFCEAAFAGAGVSDFRPVQSSLSTNVEPYTLRGMHYQAPPYAETKLVQVVQGAVYDVALDLRPDSATFGRSLGFRLSADEASGVFIPKGCAHGFLTLTPDTLLVYYMDASHKAEAARGVRWNDPAFSIDWPVDPVVISSRDAEYPDVELDEIYRHYGA
ncbi:MAG: dTDP-4-dehydrorhamnose 3,5-epimerase family protein [Pseudomonadota bacterium]